MSKNGLQFPGLDTLTRVEEPRHAGVSFDPYTLSEDAVQEPPGSLGGALRKIGPGLILAGTIIGAGELIATTHLGAKAGFALLWLVILSCFIKVFLQLELGRYAISTGETTLRGLRRLPGPSHLLPWWWVLIILAMQGAMAAMIGSIGQAFHMAVPSVAPKIVEPLGLGHRPELPWAVMTTILVVILLAVGSYRVVERVTTLMVVAFTVMTVLCVVLLPWAGHSIGWREIGSGLQFRIPPHAVGAAFAMFGMTGAGAGDLIVYPYWCIEKGYARNIGPHRATQAWLRRAKGWLRVMHLDAWVSMGAYTFATVAFYFLGAAILHSDTSGGGLPGTVAGMLQALSRMYVPVLGERIALWFIVTGAVAVLFSTLFAGTAANCRTLADFLGISNFVRFVRPEDRTQLVRRLCIGLPFFDLLLFIWFPNPVRLVLIGGIAQALSLPIIAVAAVYLRYRVTDRRLTAGSLWDIFLWIATLGMFVAATYAVWDTYKNLVG